MDRERVEESYRKLLYTWNVRDAAAFAALFTEDGTAIGFDGSQMNGREDIATTLSGIFQNHRTASYVSRVRDVRQLAPGAVLLRAVVGMVPPDEIELNPAVNAVQSVLFVERNGEPRIALLQSTPAAFHGRPEVAAALTRELEEVVRKDRLRPKS
jgi:uncharacterized protein (TIGR02246 family)